MKRPLSAEPDLFSLRATTPSSESGPEAQPPGTSALHLGQTSEHPGLRPVPSVADPADDLGPLFVRLARSAFRSRFRLGPSERDYVARKGMATICRHAEDFVRTRLAPAFPPNDGHQTPMRGHPVFIAQHATGCCCRGCLAKWHGIPAGRPLTEAEQRHIVRVLMAWIMHRTKP